MAADRLGDLRADREDRVERGHRLLEDHRDQPAAHLAQAAVAAAPGCRCRRRDRAADAALSPGSSRISARIVTLLPEPDSPSTQSTSPALELEGDAVDHAVRRVARDEAHGQIVDFDQRLGRDVGDHCVAHCMSSRAPVAQRSRCRRRAVARAGLAACGRRAMRRPRRCLRCERAAPGPRRRLRQAGSACGNGSPTAD